MPHRKKILLSDSNEALSMLLADSVCFFEHFFGCHKCHVSYRLSSILSMRFSLLYTIGQGKQRENRGKSAQMCARRFGEKINKEEPPFSLDIPRMARYNK